MTPSVGMPFSGGQDSIMNLILQIRSEATPVHLFYFRMGTSVSLVEEDGVKSIAGRISSALNFNDMRLHFINAFDLKGLSQEPNPFLPFRNYFFGQYLMGLGFQKILFSFSAEDNLFWDTSDAFMTELDKMGQNNLGHPVRVLTHTRDLCRLDYYRYIIDNYGTGSIPYEMLLASHSCASSIPCRACLCCLLRDIAQMWVGDHYDGERLSLKKKADLLHHWQGHTTLRDFYRRIISSGMGNDSARDQYWSFLETWEKGALLKGLAL